MSAKTKIVVLHMKELVYTAIFLVLAILLVALFFIMFRSDRDGEKTTETMKYVAGVYSSSILFNDSTIDVQVIVDENEIQSVSLVNLSESVATMYPLVEPALEQLTEQILKKQSTEEITYDADNQYTSMMLLNAVDHALEKAKIENQQLVETEQVSVKLFFVFDIFR